MTCPWPPETLNQFGRRRCRAAGRKWRCCSSTRQRSCHSARLTPKHCTDRPACFRQLGIPGQAVQPTAQRPTARKAPLCKLWSIESGCLPKASWDVTCGKMIPPWRGKANRILSTMGRARYCPTLGLPSCLPERPAGAHLTAGSAANPAENKSRQKTEASSCLPWSSPVQMKRWRES